MRTLISTFIVSFALVMILGACTAEVKGGAASQPVAPEGKIENLNPTLPITLQTSKTGEEKYNNFVINSNKTRYTVIYDFNNVPADIELSFGKDVEGLQGCSSYDVTRSYSWWTKDANGNYVGFEPISQTSYFKALKGQSYSLLVDVSGSQRCYSYSYEFIMKERAL